MILHLFHYDHKTGHQFATYVINQFSGPEMMSEFVFMTENSIAELATNRSVRFISPNDRKTFHDLLTSLKNYSAVVFHGLFEPWSETVLRAIPESVKVAWMFWGGEIYAYSESFLAPKTSLLFRLHNIIRRRKQSLSWRLPVELYRRIDYCMTDVEEEYEYAKRFIRSEKLSHIWYSYYSIEDTIGDYSHDPIGNNVLIGNSAAIENNHVDIVASFFLPWNRKCVHDKRVIIPLSYGSRWVRNVVVRMASIVFSSRFYPLVDFLPRNEYNRYIQSCSTVILLYYRPAAQGNIITALWLGKRVYLSEHSMIYSFFKRIGAHVFSFESEFRHLGCKGLTESEILHNRSVLQDWYGREHVKKACCNVVKCLN